MSWASISAKVLIRSPVAKASAASLWPTTLVLSNLIELGQALDVVDVGMRGDQHLALRERKVELADQLDDLVDRLFVADVDQQPLGPVEDQVDVAAHALAGLVVHFDDVGEDGLPLEHGLVLPGSQSGRVLDTSPVHLLRLGVDRR